MSSEKFCLKWNDFETNISGAFRELRDDSDFFDVTLACDDEEQVSAHKVILSACSPFFRQLLRRHKHQHPLLYLRGVTFSDLESVLAFMYHGEVNIAQDQLNSFLAIAEDLKVKGLTQGKEGTQSNTERSKTPVSSSRPSQRNSNTGQSIPPVSKRPRQEPVSFQDDDIQEVVPVKTETSAVAMEEATYEEEGYEDYGSYHDQQFEVGGAGVGAGAMAMMPGGMEVTKDSEIDDQVASLTKRVSSNVWECSECGKQASQRTDLKKHIEAAHLDLQLPCDLCGIPFKTRHHRQNHVRTAHGFSSKYYNAV